MDAQAEEQPVTVGEVLERDHHRIDGFFADFEESLSTGTINTEALAEGSGGLRHHIWVEEEYHFPAMRTGGLFGPVMVMLREHGELWDLLDRMEGQSRTADDVDELIRTWKVFSA
ncbi:MAG: hemerythrin domain-containing protein, partial [Brevibacterium sp.]|nr:hemerythrin domain-containing protein [Brevibacterium sp.]